MKLRQNGQQENADHWTKDVRNVSRLLQDNNKDMSNNGPLQTTNHLLRKNLQVAVFYCKTFIYCGITYIYYVLICFAMFVFCLGGRWQLKELLYLVTNSLVFTGVAGTDSIIIIQHLQ